MIKQNCKHNFQINIHYSIKYSVAAFAKSCPEPNYSSLNCSLKTQNQTRGLLYNIAVHARNKTEGWVHRGLGSPFLLPALRAAHPAVKISAVFTGKGSKALLAACFPLQVTAPTARLHSSPRWAPLGPDARDAVQGVMALVGQMENGPASSPERWEARARTDEWWRGEEGGAGAARTLLGLTQQDGAEAGTQRQVSPSCCKIPS